MATPIQLFQFLNWRIKQSLSSQKKALHQQIVFLNDDAVEVSNPKVALILHSFYPEIGLEILNQVVVQANHFDKVLITHNLSPQDQAKFREEIPIELAEKCRLMWVENKHRDCGPFIEAANSEYLHDCEVFLKLHTKKSPHLRNDEGTKWRRGLVDSLLHREDLTQLIGQLNNAAEPMWACPEPWLSTKSQWGFNSFQVWSLTQKLKLQYRGPKAFPNGNMYWMNKNLLEILRQIKPPTKKNFTYILDGTFSHAYERLPSLMKVSSMTDFKTYNPEYSNLSKV